MKKYISLSAEILAFTYIVKEATSKRIEITPSGIEGRPDIEKEVDVITDVEYSVALSQGNVTSLPEDNDHVKGLVIKGLIRELIEDETAKLNTPVSPNEEEKQGED
jgi:hypothetical protein